MTLEQLTAFCGWMSVINICLFLLTVTALLFIKPWMLEMHTKMFGVDAPGLRKTYVKFVGMYKMSILMLNVAPYFALKLLG